MAEAMSSEREDRIRSPVRVPSDVDKVSHLKWRQASLELLRAEIKVLP